MKPFSILALLLISLSPASANTDGDNDDSLKFILAKSPVVIAGTINVETVGFMAQIGVIDYVIPLKNVEVLRGHSVPKEITIGVSRFETGIKDKLPYFEKNNKCIFFLKVYPRWEPIYCSSDFWLSVLPYSQALRDRVIAISNTAEQGAAANP